MVNSSEPVFIVGGSRTGSEMLKTMLSASPQLDFVDELFLLCPRWLHRDLASNIKEQVGPLDGDNAVERLLELLYSGKPYGWFWSVVADQLERDRLEAALRTGPLSLRSLFEAIMTVHAEMRDKRGIGAKFPMHYSYTPLLLEWFPNCRLLHTTREPKAVYASQASKYIDGKSGFAARGWMKFRQFIHINLQITWTSMLHRKMSGLPNYRLIRYEDVVADPEDQMREICRFLDIEFLPTMLEPKQYGSSFGRLGSGSGIESSSLERWRSTVWPLTATLIDLLHRRASRVFGYR